MITLETLREAHDWCASHSAIVTYETDREHNVYIQVDYDLHENPTGSLIEGSTRVGPFKNTLKGFVEAVQAARTTHTSMLEQSRKEFRQ